MFTLRFPPSLKAGKMAVEEGLEDLIKPQGQAQSTVPQLRQGNSLNYLHQRQENCRGRRHEPQQRACSCSMPGHLIAASDLEPCSRMINSSWMAWRTWRSREALGSGCCRQGEVCMSCVGHPEKWLGTTIMMSATSAADTTVLNPRSPENCCSSSNAKDLSSLRHGPIPLAISFSKEMTMPGKENTRCKGFSRESKRWSAKLMDLINFITPRLTPLDQGCAGKPSVSR